MYTGPTDEAVTPALAIFSLNAAISASVMARTSSGLSTFTPFLTMKYLMPVYLTSSFCAKSRIWSISYLL